MLMYGAFLRYSAITGKLLSGGYMPFTIATNLLLGQERLVAVLSHPLLAGVQYFDGGTQSYRFNVTLASNATLVASWSGAPVPLIAVKRRVVG